VITESIPNPRDYYVYSTSLVNGVLTINNGTSHGTASQLALFVVDGQLIVDAPDTTKNVVISTSQRQTRSYEWDGLPPWGQWSSWRNSGSPQTQRANISIPNASNFNLASVSKIVINGANVSESIVFQAGTVNIDADIRGNGGNDVISTGGGNDRVWGGSGNDIIFTYGGNDELYGEGNNDKLFGGIGNDHLDGGSGDDLLDENKDRVNPGVEISETNTLIGGSGQDTILGSPGRDTITAGSGNDLILGMVHNDLHF
jgi:Ca2+-binding RTX toxin-like protein